MVIVVTVWLWLVVSEFTSLQMVSSLETLDPTLLIVIVVLLSLLSLSIYLRHKLYA